MAIDKKPGKIDAGPEPSADCPRCHHFAKTQRRRDDRMRPNPWPPLDQQKVDRILRIAFPQSQRR